MERIKVLDDFAWGKLVKTWVTGRSYLDNGYLPPNYPRTIKEFNEQCARAKGSPINEKNPLVELPPSIVGIVVLQYSPEVLSLRLPPKDMVEMAEKEMADKPDGTAGAPYEVPAFYDRAYEGPPTLIGEDAKMRFHAERIGDYSIRNCG